MKTITLTLVATLLVAAPLSTALAATDAAVLDALRAELAAQSERLEAQEAELKAQRQALAEQRETLNRQTEQLLVLIGDSSSKNTKRKAPAGPPVRDAVGDLNNKAIREGEYDGTVQTVGEGINLSIGGFLKTVAIMDSDAEAAGADLLPATFGVARNDEDGAFALDSTMARLYLDSQAAAPGGGRLRGYFETDLNDGNDGEVNLNIRHAFGTWENRNGTLLAGHTWSTFMDLKTLPQALTEPTFSGAAFTRQAQVRWSQPFGDGFIWHAAIEDPNSDDIFNQSSVPNLDRTKIPDMVLGLEYVQPWGHLRVNGLARELRVDQGADGSDETFAGGVALTGSINFSEANRFTFGGVTGEGLGRYLLGILPINGAAIDPDDNNLKTRDNRGLYGNFTHRFDNALSAAIMLGYAESDPLDFESDDTLDNTTYAAANLIWKVLPYLSLGVEYGYGRRENKGGDDLDNHRLMFGVQVY